MRPAAGVHRLRRGPDRLHRIPEYVPRRKSGDRHHTGCPAAILHWRLPAVWPRSPAALQGGSAGLWRLSIAAPECIAEGYARCRHGQERKVRGWLSSRSSSLLWPVNACPTLFCGEEIQAVSPEHRGWAESISAMRLRTNCVSSSVWRIVIPTVSMGSPIIMSTSQGKKWE